MIFTWFGFGDFFASHLKGLPVVFCNILTTFSLPSDIHLERTQNFPKKCFFTPSYAHLLVRIRRCALLSFLKIMPVAALMLGKKEACRLVTSNSCHKQCKVLEGLIKRVPKVSYCPLALHTSPS